MTGKRHYEDSCAAAQALNLLGERWALLVVRELLLGPKRFTDLRASLPGISPNVLTQRLNELESAWVLKRIRLPAPSSAWVYALTAWGQELEPIILRLGQWGARSPQLDRQAPISQDSIMLSIRAMFQPEAAVDWKARVELRFGSDTYYATVDNGKISTGRGPADTPDLILETDPGTLASILYDKRSPADAVQAGQLTMTGSKALLKRWTRCFKLPPPVSTA